MWILADPPWHIDAVGGRSHHQSPGEGDDDANYGSSGAAVDVDLIRNGAQSGGEANNDVLISIEGLVGSDFNDKLAGNSASNTLFGGKDPGKGNDTLIGRSGFDRLYGGEGNDRLEGGDGADVLNGGTGADRFVFGVNTGEDTIAAFNFAEGDRIEFTSASGVNGAFAFVGSFTGGGDNAEARLAGNRVLIDSNGDGSADIWITVNNFEGSSGLSGGAFVVM